MEEEKRERKAVWNFMDSIKGDKVLLIIFICLIMISILALFSSTSLKVTASKSRIDIFIGQLAIVAFGCLCAFCIYKNNRISLFRKLSQFGFFLSFVILFLLDIHVKIPGLCVAETYNSAWRVLKIFGKFQFHVFEFTKIFMVLYLAWAVQAWDRKWGVSKEREYGESDMKVRSSGFRMTEYLSQKYERLSFLGEQFWEEIVYIFLPIALICLMVMPGSNSSMIFIGLVMIATILIGGFSVKRTMCLGIICIALVGGCFALNSISDGKIFGGLRSEELTGRLSRMGDNFDKEFIEKYESLKKKEISNKEFREFIDANLQEQGAKIAIHEGKRIKGPGGSTQKYSVPQIFGDYMFSFLIEEYGILGGILILFLFGSLLSRGAFIAKNCTGIYARTAVGGLTLLISGQAAMHILVNVKLFPMTGQTLPLISDGKTAFVAFSIAFGILMSISKMAKANIEEAEREISLKREIPGDEVSNGLSELDEFDAEKDYIQE